MCTTDPRQITRRDKRYLFTVCTRLGTIVKRKFRIELRNNDKSSIRHLSGDFTPRFSRAASV